MSIQQLKERYAEPEIPKCRVCGGELTIQRAGGGPTIWGCTGMIDDLTGKRNWVYAEGRECADEHYERSRWSDYRQGGDADVIELIDALEAAERERDELRSEIKKSSANAMVWMKRALKAEAEIARRDAAAGEPVAYTSQANLDAVSLKQPKQLEFMTGDKGIYRNPISLYTDAPPAGAGLLLQN